MGRMNEYLEQVRAAVESGAAEAEQTVLLFRAIEEAELQRDMAALEHALKLARQISVQADDKLRVEADHLARLCAERLDAVRQLATVGVLGGSGELCPGCGRTLSGSPVRCRSCGQVFV